MEMYFNPLRCIVNVARVFLTEHVMHQSLLSSVLGHWTLKTESFPKTYSPKGSVGTVFKETALLAAFRRNLTKAWCTQTMLFHWSVRLVRLAVIELTRTFQPLPSFNAPGPMTMSSDPHRATARTGPHTGPHLPSQPIPTQLLLPLLHKLIMYT